MYALSLMFVVLAIVLALLSLASLHRQRPHGEDDSWRDRLPLLFRLVRPVVGLFAHHVAERMNSGYRDLLTERLQRGGVGYVMRPEEFVVTRRMGLVTGVILCLMLMPLAGEAASGWRLALIAAALLFIPLGLLYPDLWLRDAIKRRQALIQKQFPFLLDLIVLTMQAGLSFAAALGHAVERLPAGPVREEMRRVLRETRTGVTRREALGRLARRTGVSAVRNVVGAINHAEETGGELAGILLSQARQLRRERFLRAEKLANQAPMKLLLPLIGLLFPVTFLIIVFPLFMKARDSGTLAFFF